jgi:dephospho-CoA kinase
MIYEVHGLRVKTSIPFPEIGHPSDQKGRYDAKIREEKIYRDDSISNVKRQKFSINKKSIDYVIPEVGYIRIKNDDEIILDKKNGPVDRVSRLFVLGIGLSILLYKRGKLVLHSSAVKTNEGTALFVGEKGAGKSTLAATFASEGRRVISDDIVNICFDEKVNTNPGVPSIKLWKKSLHLLEDENLAIERVHDEIKKYIVIPDRINKNSRHEVKGIFSLGFDEDISVRRVRPRDSFSKLLRHSYLPKSLIKSMGAQKGHFRRCVRLSREVPMYHLNRPEDYSLSNEVLGLIESTLNRSNSS